MEYKRTNHFSLHLCSKLPLEKSERMVLQRLASWVLFPLVFGYLLSWCHHMVNRVYDDMLQTVHSVLAQH
jgi:hypothetical protein